MAHIPRALVVEDDARMRRIVAKVLTGCGIIVRAAGDGVEALNAFRASRDEPELICADIRMPNMDGREFARRLRRDGVDVPIVFISGTIPKNQEGYREKSHVYLVSKPFSPTELAEVVKEMLAKPRPRLGPRVDSQPVSGPEELPPLPSPSKEITPGYSHEDFPRKAKSAAMTVPQSPERPFSGSPRPTPPIEAEDPEPVPQPVPVPVPIQGVQRAEGASGAAPRKKKAHETTVMFLKPISAVEVPSSGPSQLKPKPAPPPAPMEAAPAAEAVTHFVNVERRIREDGPAELRKPGNWVPRLIVWPESSAPEVQKRWCGVVAAALATVQTAGGLEAYAFAPLAKPDPAGRRWRARRGVQVDGALFQAVLDRKLHGLFLLAPRDVSHEAVEPYLREKQLDRGNVLGLGAALADLDCAGPSAVMDVTFLRDEPAFLRALNDSCASGGCAMRRGEWKPGG